MTYSRERVASLMPSLWDPLAASTGAASGRIPEGMPRAKQDPSHSCTPWAESADLSVAWSACAKRARGEDALALAVAYLRHAADYSRRDAAAHLGLGYGLAGERTAGRLASRGISLLVREINNAPEEEL